MWTVMTETRRRRICTPRIAIERYLVDRREEARKGVEMSW